MTNGFAAVGRICGPVFEAAVFHDREQVRQEEDSVDEERHVSHCGELAKHELSVGDRGDSKQLPAPLLPFASDRAVKPKRNGQSAEKQLAVDWDVRFETAT